MLLQEDWMLTILRMLLIIACLTILKYIHTEAAVPEEQEKQESQFHLFILGRSIFFSRLREGLKKLSRQSLFLQELKSVGNSCSTGQINFRMLPLSIRRSKNSYLK